jgi:hypothetical protein
VCEGERDVRGGERERAISRREKVKEIFFLLLRQMMCREIRIPNSNIYPEGSLQMKCTL